MPDTPAGPSSVNPPPNYVEGHGLLDDKNVVITAAAGTGIGFAVARRCA
jgi:3-oxoacyl-[acyl-carrier protein] reductase